MLDKYSSDEFYCAHFIIKRYVAFLISEINIRKEQLREKYNQCNIHDLSDNDMYSYKELYSNMIKSSDELCKVFLLIIDQLEHFYLTNIDFECGFSRSYKKDNFIYQSQEIQSILSRLKEIL